MTALKRHFNPALKVAKERKSSVLSSNAYHHRVDSLTAFVALLTIGGSNVLQNATWLDPVGGLIISLMVIQAGWANTKTSLLELADVAVEDEMRQKVERAASWAIRELSAESDVEVRQVQGLKSGQNYLMDVELLTPSSWPLDRMRKLEDAIRGQVGSKVRGVKRVKVRSVPKTMPEKDYWDEFIRPEVMPQSSPEPESDQEQSVYTHERSNGSHKKRGVSKRN